MKKALLYTALFTVVLSFPSVCAVAVKPIADAMTVFFSSNRTGNYEIYRICSGETIKITDDKRFDSWWPVVSPDKKTIAFYRSPAKNKNNNYAEAALWMMDISGGNQRRVIALSNYNWKAQGVANWSPDGARLVMTATASEDNRWHIYITDANGGNAVKVSRRTSLYVDPSFSPDGKKIVCGAFPDDYNGMDLARLEIFTMNLDGSDEQRLTRDNIRDHDPCWSPDGREIAFESSVEPFLNIGKWALRSVKPDGTGLRRILHDGNINTLPRWSADSSALYFHRLVFGGLKFRIARVNGDGTGLVYITAEKANYDDTDAEPIQF